MVFRTLPLLLAVFVAAPVYAGEFDFILGDVDKFEQHLQWQIDAEVQALDDHEYQEMDELFLLVDEEDLEEDEEGLQQATPYVTVRIDGIPVTFSDVPTDSWFGPYVRGAAETGVVSGYRDNNGRLLGTFGPADDVTIEQLAKMALQSAGIDLLQCAGEPRNESAQGSWSAKYISCAEELRWAVYSDGSVEVSRPATRSEVVVTIIQAFAIDFSRGSGEIFDDVTASTEFSGAIEMAASAGVVEGYKDEYGELIGLFGPADPVNRAEVAKIVLLAEQIYGQQ